METAVTPRQKIITKIEANPALVSRKNSNRPLNVAAYCRVSTDAEDQINSYGRRFHIIRSIFLTIRNGVLSRFMPMKV